MRKPKQNMKDPESGRIDLKHGKRASQPACVITVFLALAFTCIVTLVFALEESARTAGMRYYPETAANAALDSLFSQYHNGMWEKYRIAVLYEEDRETIPAEYLKFIEPYRKAENWLTMKDVTAEIVQCDALTDNGGAWLEQEILDYMQYGITEELLEVEADPEGLLQDLKEAEALRSVTDGYAGQMKEAEEIEKCIRKLNDSAAAQKTYRESAMQALSRESNASFQSASQRLAREIRNFTSEVKTYRRKADALSQKIETLRRENAAACGNLSAESAEYLESLAESYDSYLNENGERRQLIEAADAESSTNLAIIDEVQDASMDVYANWADVPPVYDEYGNLLIPGRSYAAERTAEWRRLRSEFSDVAVYDLNLSCGVRDESRENAFENAKSQLSGDLLSLMLPDGVSVSGRTLDKVDIPSLYQTELRESEERNLAENAVIAKYSGNFFRNFVSLLEIEDEEETPAQKRTAGKEDSTPASKEDAEKEAKQQEEKQKAEVYRAGYEMEYIAAGENSDKENLSEVMGKVFAMREGMNYLHILRSSNLRSEAETLASAIVGSTGLPLLQPIVTCLIIGVWAGGESLLDCRKLLAGHRIPLMKTEEDWELDIGSVLSLGKNRTVSLYRGEKENGVPYAEYLEFLILLLDADERNYRMMDMMQCNLRGKDQDFRMRNCIYGIKIKNTCTVKHLFTPLGDGQMVCDAEKAY